MSLKHCPFCGAPPYARSVTVPVPTLTDELAQTPAWVVECTARDCGASMVSYESAAMVFAMWNRRV